MPHYLIQLGYVPKAWDALIDEPENRIEAVTPAIKAVGGRFVDAWLSFGEFDLVGIAEFPDNVSAAAFSMAVEAGGGVEQYRTTPLLTMEEGMDALKKAQATGYKPPQE
jgi:uncharacterized protein with GYD domain